MRIKDWTKVEEMGFEYIGHNIWKKGKNKYVKKEHCKNCNEPFLGRAHNIFCSKNCSTSYTKKDIKFSGKHKEKISKSLKGNINGWKGCYRKKGLASYDTYAPQLKWAEEVRRNQEDQNVLEVKCFKCDEWFIPSYNSVSNKVLYLKGKRNTEQHFYCSDVCKHSCSVYHKSPEILMKEDAVRSGRLPWLELTREIQPELRKIVLERDNNECQKCGEINNLQCHHILPVNIEPLLSADIDNCMTLCKKCHIEAHQKDGCGYNQLHIEEC